MDVGVMIAKMKTGYIYSLNDPITDVPRYIGLTFYLHKRKLSHFNSNEKTHKGNWIKSLRNNGLLPVMEIIDTVNENEIKFWEQHYISLYKSWGFKLVNGTLGGDGTFGYKYSKEQIDKTIQYKRESGILKSTAIKIAATNKANGVYERARERMKKNNPNKCKGIPVLQYSLDGIFIKEWNSAKEATIKLGIPKGSIGRNCKGEYKATYGFIFKYKTNNYPLLINPYNKSTSCFNKGRNKRVEQYSLEGKFLKEWNSASEASIENGISITYIRSACNGFYEKAGGYKWKYKDC